MNFNKPIGCSVCHGSTGGRSAGQSEVLSLGSAPSVRYLVSHTQSVTPPDDNPPTARLEDDIEALSFQGPPGTVRDADSHHSLSTSPSTRPGDGGSRHGHSDKGPKGHGEPCTRRAGLSGAKGSHPALPPALDATYAETPNCRKPGLHHPAEPDAISKLCWDDFEPFLIIAIRTIYDVDPKRATHIISGVQRFLASRRQLPNSGGGGPSHAPADSPGGCGGGRSTGCANFRGSSNGSSASTTPQKGRENGRSDRQRNGSNDPGDNGEGGSGDNQGGDHGSNPPSGRKDQRSPWVCLYAERCEWEINLHRSCFRHCSLRGLRDRTEWYNHHIHNHRPKPPRRPGTNRKECDSTAHSNLLMNEEQFEDFKKLVETCRNRGKHYDKEQQLQAALSCMEEARVILFSAQGEKGK
ncbi:hypothetical protein F5Y16DRAFT_246773 [Xylariaceae sp. FL0255]|nr:hypothetical protein F5Y16DRAFT_246773 [Xylariaceae sp. FL0255]